MNASQVAAAKTAELLAFYNANSGKAPVARFSDRASAERRVNALIAELAAKAPAPAPVKATSKKAERQAEAARRLAAVKAHSCPACGNEHDQTAGRCIDRNGRQETVEEHIGCCHSCGETYDVNTGKKARYSNNRAPGNNAAGVAASWTRDEVRAARAARHAVVVAGKGQFKSVAQAFKALRLESKLIIRTRAKLVAEGSVEVGGFNFRLA